MAELINTSLNNFVLLGIDKNTRIVFFNRLENTHAMVDREKILQVLNNVISNSVKFTENGTITVTAETKNRYIHLSIEDTGIGMDKNQIDNLFTQYGYSPSRGTRGEKGNGLGLVICKKFIDLHNGSIELESEMGKGTKFLITIPEK
jgi:signal transduction histidine kinase